MARGAILGDWTHRRGDAGGARSLLADVGRARPSLAWAWRPPHGGRVDQVRIVRGVAHVATMAPADPDAPGWEHGTIFALEATTGRVMASRVLADPVPVAALSIDHGVVHVIATRKDEPIFLYELGAYDLRPRRRCRIELDQDEQREDVLDAWPGPHGGTWLEVEGRAGRARSYAFAAEGRLVSRGETVSDDVETITWGAPARDACTDGLALFAPTCHPATDDAEGPAVYRLVPEKDADVGGVAQPWARFDLRGSFAQAHALAAEGTVHAIAAARDAEKDDRAVVQAMAVDRASGVVRWSTALERLPLRGSLGEAARLARRPNGELLFQRIGAEGAPCSDLLRVRTDGSSEVLPLGGAHRFVLDAALGDLVLAHRDLADGRVLIAGFKIDGSVPLLGSRASMVWSVETPDIGGSTTVYAGAGHVVARGRSAVVGIRF